MEFPMQRTLARLLATLAFSTTAALNSTAEDYQCRDSAGCTAQIPDNGQLKTVSFRKGDLVSTEDGWIVNPDDGWRRVRTRRTRT